MPPCGSGLAAPGSEQAGPEPALLCGPAASHPAPHAPLAPAGSYKVIATGQAVAIHPSSVLAGKKPECIVFNELVSWPGWLFGLVCGGSVLGVVCRRIGEVA